MKLYIRFGSLAKFQNMFDSNEFMRTILRQTRSNMYHIDTDIKEEIAQLKHLLNKNNIKYSISEE